MLAKKQRKKSLKNKTKSQATYEWLVAKGKEFSKDLRNKATPYEKSFYKTLKDLHYKFEFQVPIICNKKHLYIADFVLIDSKLIIEIDGVSCHSSKEDVKKDNRRTKLLKKEGYEVLRFWNKQVSIFTKEQIDQIIKSKIQLIVNNS